MALDWETVKDAEVRYIRGLLRKRNLDNVRRIGIDEVSVTTARNGNHLHRDHRGPRDHLARSGPGRVTA